MRFYILLNLHDIILYIIPTLIFILIFGLGLSHTHFYTKHAEERKNRIIHRFPDGIEERNAPFPLVLTLIIAGTLIWAFCYIFGMGLTGIKI